MRLLRPLLLGLCVCNMLVAGLFFASDASARDDNPPAFTCPDGFTLNANTCRQVVEPVRLADCPAGYTLDTSTGQPCVATAAAVALPDTCPAGALGLPDACYVLVEIGPPGDLVCGLLLNEQLDGASCTGSLPPDPINGCDGIAEDSFFAVLRDVDFVLVGDACVGVYPANRIAAQCPVPAVEDSAGNCRLLVSNETNRVGCTEQGAVLVDTTCVTRTGFVAYGSCFDAITPATAASGLCQVASPAVSIAPMCPAGASGTPGSCYEIVPRDGFFCIEDSAVLVGDTCIVEGNPPFAAADGSLQCGTGFAFANGGCRRAENANTIPNPQCPAEAIDVGGECRRTVATAEAGLGCVQADAVLVGTNCLVVGDATSACPTTPAVAVSQPDGITCVVVQAANNLELRAPVAPYPGPFTNVPAGPKSSLLDAPDITMPGATIMSASASAPASPADASLTELAHTGAGANSLAASGLASLSAGFLFLALSRRQDHQRI